MAGKVHVWLSFAGILFMLHQVAQAGTFSRVPAPGIISAPEDSEAVQLMSQLGDEVLSKYNVSQLVNKGSCSCKDSAYTCSCCADLPLLKQLSPACVTVNFEPAQLTLELSLTLNGKVIYKHSVSVKNPPPLCFPIPFGKKGKACIEITNIHLDKDALNACVKVEVTYNHIPIKLDLGCFSIPLHKMYQEYMAKKFGIENADTDILHQWVWALEKAQMVKKVQQVLNTV